MYYQQNMRITLETKTISSLSDMFIIYIKIVIQYLFYARPYFSVVLITFFRILLYKCQYVLCCHPFLTPSLRKPVTRNRYVSFGALCKSCAHFYPRYTREQYGGKSTRARLSNDHEHSTKYSFDDYCFGIIGIGGIK